MSLQFSVLLSLYYKESPIALRQSLDSIYQQSLKADEIVIVKDGPLTKDLEAVLLEYTSLYSNIKIVPLAQNQGLGKALNEGLKYCSHQLIARMDTDDIAKPCRFEKQIEVFKNNPHIDVCSAWIEEFDSIPSNIISIKKLPENHTDISKYAKHRCPINHPVVMYKKDAVLKVGGYSGFPEDYNLWIKLLMNGYIFYNIQESLLLFRFSYEMIKRRGGWSYAKSDIKSQIDFYSMGFFNISTLIYNIFVRTFVRLIPNKQRTFIYKTILR